jgi:hypothetical protein
MQFERKQYRPGMLLVGGDCPVEFDSTVHKSAPPSPVKHDVAAEALAAYRVASARMAADRERLKEAGRYLTEVQRLVKTAQERQHDFWVTEACSRSRRLVREGKL